MKQVLKAINTALIADTTLKTLLSYDANTHNIRTFESLKKYDFDTMLLFGKLTARKVDDKLTTTLVRKYSLQIQALDTSDHLLVDDIVERVITVLHNTKLEVASEIRSMLCEWENSMPVFYDNEIKRYVGVAYFNIIVVNIS